CDSLRQGWSFTPESLAVDCCRAWRGQPAEVSRVGPGGLRLGFDLPFAYNPRSATPLAPWCPTTVCLSKTRRSDPCVQWVWQCCAWWAGAGSPRP
ncbi:MAG: hypothetical protein ACK559_09385, partial [bacterium]